MKKNLGLILWILLTVMLVSGFQTSDPAVITRGEWSTVDEQEIFVNQSLDLAFTLPDDFMVMSDEEISKAANIGMETLDLDEIDFSKVNLSYDFMISSPNKGESVQMMMEKTFYSAENYLKATQSQFENLGLGGADINNMYYMDIAEKEFAVLPILLENYGINEYLCVRNYDTFIVALIFTGPNMSETRFTELSSLFFSPED